MDIGRKADIAELAKAAKSRNPIVRKNAKEAGEKIQKEQGDGWLRSAREALIKEKRNGNADNARDVSEQIYEHTKHKEVIGNTSWYFNLPDSFFEK